MNSIQIQMSFFKEVFLIITVLSISPARTESSFTTPQYWEYASSRPECCPVKSVVGLLRLSKYLIVFNLTSQAILLSFLVSIFWFLPPDITSLKMTILPAAGVIPVSTSETTTTMNNTASDLLRMDHLIQHVIQVNILIIKS